MILNNCTAANTDEPDADSPPVRRDAAVVCPTCGATLGVPEVGPDGKTWLASGNMLLLAARAVCRPCVLAGRIDEATYAATVRSWKASERTPETLARRRRRVNWRA